MWKFQGSIKKENKFLGGYFHGYGLWFLILEFPRGFFRISKGKVTNLKIPGFSFFQKSISSTPCLDFSLISPATHLNYKILVSIKHRRVSDKDYAGNKILFSYDGSSFTNEQKLLALPNKLATSFIKFLFLLLFYFTDPLSVPFGKYTLWPTSSDQNQVTQWLSNHPADRDLFRNKEKRQLASYLKIAWEQTQKITH